MVMFVFLLPSVLNAGSFDIVLTYDSNFPDSLKPAAEYATQRWETWIVNTASGDASTLEITLQWDSLGGVTLANADPSWWGHAGNLALTPAQYMFQTGNDLEGEDGVIKFNADKSWYSGTDGNPGGTENDFVSVMLHEIGHQMGISHSYRDLLWPWDWGWGYAENWPLGDWHLTKWDTYLRDQEQGGNAPAPRGTPESFDEQSEYVWFTGESAKQANEGNPVRIQGLVDGEFRPGSSLSHVAKAGKSDALMFYATSPTHGMYDFERGIFQDLGWQFASLSEVHVFGKSNKYWQHGAAWQEGLPPTAQTAVYIDASVQSEYIVVVDKDVSAGTLTVSGPGKLRLDSGMLSVGGNCINDGHIEINPGASTSVGNSLYVGNSGSGVLNITNGGAVSSDWGYIGYSSGSTGVVTVDGTGSTWTNRLSLYIGYKGSGVLNITGGGAVNNGWYSYIGYSAGSTGEVTVDGAGSTWWTTGNYPIVGYSGKGTLNITGGGAVSSSKSWDFIGYNSGSTGEVTVDGVGSIWTNIGNLSVGTFGNGMLNITGGGAVSDSYGVIGNRSVSTGEVTVDGANSTWTSTDDLYVGFLGNGVLNITGGGAVSNSFGRIGWMSGSTGEVTVDGAGSTWTSEGLYVGDSGSGVLNITGGGTVSDLTGHIGYASASTGEVTVDGIGSTWTNDGPLYVGRSGSGVLNITGGGTVSSGFGYVGHKSGSTGVVTVDGAGSTWTNSSYLYIGYEGNGVLNITGGGAVSSGRGHIGYQFGSTGVVTVNGAGSTWTNSGKLIVGNEGSGTLNIENGGAVVVGGNLSINSLSTLNILLGSLGDPLLDVAGNAVLDGTLNVDLASELVLEQGDLITLIDLTDISKTISGTFAGLLDGDSVGNFGGLDLLVSYGGGDGNDMTLLAILMGDANRDDFVSADDYGSVQLNFGDTGAPGLPGDANGDGAVSADDYGSVQLNFGAIAGMGGETPVPEPATLALLGIGGLAMLRQRSAQVLRQRSAQVLRRRSAQVLRRRSAQVLRRRRS